MANQDDRPIELGRTILAFFRTEWDAVLDALDGDQASRDIAFDAMHRWAPYGWVQAWEDAEEVRMAAE